MDQCQVKAKPLNADYLCRRTRPLCIEGFHGSVDSPHACLQNTDAVVCVELYARRIHLTTESIHRYFRICIFFSGLSICSRKQKWICRTIFSVAWNRKSSFLQRRIRITTFYLVQPNFRLDSGMTTTNLNGHANNFAIGIWINLFVGRIHSHI